MKINLAVLHHYVASMLSSIVRIYTNGILTDTLSMRSDLNDRTLYAQCIEPAILPICADAMPVLLSIDSHVVYGKVQTPNQVLVIGPVYSNEPMTFCHTLSTDQLQEEFLHKVPVCLLSFLLNQLLLLHNLYARQEVKFWDCLNENCLNVKVENIIEETTSKVLFHNRENGNRHNPYEQEKRELSSIENGDLVQLKSSWDEQYAGSLGMTSPDPIRNGKNLAIIVVSMATRAAIRGGILPEIAFTLGDNYMLQIDQTRNVYEIGSLVKEAEYTLTNMVKEKKSGHAVPKESTENHMVNRCKDYVFSHLHGKITVQEIAEALYLNPNYLSSLFKKVEGISLYQYILNEKITLVKNLLIYSQYSFSEISSYLGFSSQSHLGKAFKKATGYTLKSYRNAFAKSESFS